MEALLRDEFSREIEAQRAKVPDWRSIAAMAGPRGARGDRSDRRDKNPKDRNEAAARH